MATLVINAPKWRSDSEAVRSFDQTLASGIGQGYAIPSRLHAQCRPGGKVVLLCKDEAKRAEGILEKLVPTEKTASGMQRYDVYMSDLERVPYSPEALGELEFPSSREYTGQVTPKLIEPEAEADG